MNNKWKISLLSTLISLSFLSACNVDNNEINEQDEVDYRPVRNDRDTDLNENINDENRTNKPFPHDETPEQTDEKREKGDDLEFDRNRGAE